MSRPRQGRPRQRATVHIIGNVNVDLILGPLAPWPVPGTEHMLPHGEMRVGGAAGNAALALGALGVPFRLVCNIGDDLFGRWLARAFGPAGRGWPVAPVATTLSVGITHPNGERTFLTPPGHLEVMTMKDAERRLPAQAGPGDIALLLGCFLSPRLLESYETLIDLLVARGFAIALDTGWPSGGWSPHVARRVAVWLKACDHVLLNEIESRSLSRQADVERAAAWLCGKTKPGATVVIKQGVGGATAWRGGERVHVAAPRVAVIDTIGAGDAFDAGYLAGCLAGLDLAGAVARGVAVASAAVSTSPRQYGAGRDGGEGDGGLQALGPEAIRPRGRRGAERG
jgi:sugar/nucleoside kinase (ribokinase family)